MGCWENLGWGLLFLVSAWNQAVVRLQGGECDKVQAPAEMQISQRKRFKSASGLAYSAGKIILGKSSHFEQLVWSMDLDNYALSTDHLLCQPNTFFFSSSRFLLKPLYSLGNSSGQVKEDFCSASV